MKTTKDLYCEHSLHIFKPRILRSGSIVEKIHEFTNLYGSYVRYKDENGDIFDILKITAEQFIQDE